MAPYRGRFAPSPTGLLHTGSLVAALASWLDARAHGGRWLVRMEDLDAPRCVPGAADAILSTLAAFGMHSDEPVLYQSTRHDAYDAALAQLVRTGHAYRCTCTRSDAPGPYSGHCRALSRPAPSAWRLRLAEGACTFTDNIQGVMESPSATLGDPVIFRRDGVAAYQLAVVVDDAAQGITHVVRGADLLESTAWQIAIARALHLPVPQHAHVPLVTEPGGAKLAKSRRSVPLAARSVGTALIEALDLLRQQPPAQLHGASVSQILSWGVDNWRPGQLSGLREQRIGS